MIIIMSVCQSR